jgi:hypothetical protein
VRPKDLGRAPQVSWWWQWHGDVHSDLQAELQNSFYRFEPDLFSSTWQTTRWPVDSQGRESVAPCAVADSASAQVHFQPVLSVDRFLPETFLHVMRMSGTPGFIRDQSDRNQLLGQVFSGMARLLPSVHYKRISSPTAIRQEPHLANIANRYRVIFVVRSE